VRFVGSPDKRATYLRERENISHKAALARIEREDKGRIRYVKKYFDTKADDPLLYHLTVNTDDLPLSEVTKIIADLVLPPIKSKRS
jgi:cytidylate kinase